MRLTFAAIATATAVISMMVPTISEASAEDCPDVEVIFARGTNEAPGIGPTGEAFVDALRNQLTDRSLSVYPVSYPATDQWATGIDGIGDAGAKVLSVTKDCPNTHIVLGGYSQGAAVIGFVTSETVPGGVDPGTVPKPLPPGVAEHVSAVTLFGLPNVRAMNLMGEPPVVIGPQYLEKTLQLCAPEDPVCSDGLNFAVHNPSSYNGFLANQAAAYAAARVKAT